MEYEEKFAYVARYALLGQLFSLLQNGVEDTLDGCEDCLPQWGD